MFHNRVALNGQPMQNLREYDIGGAPCKCDQATLTNSGLATTNYSVFICTMNLTVVEEQIDAPTLVAHVTTILTIFTIPVYTLKANCYDELHLYVDGVELPVTNSANYQEAGNAHIPPGELPWLPW